MGGWNRGKTLANWTQKVLDKFGESFVLVAVGDTQANGERTITVRCLKCGTEKDVSSNSFKGKWSRQGHCEVCSVKETESRKAITKQNDQTEKSIKRMRKRLETKQVGFRFCECGAILAYRERICKDCVAKHKAEYKQKQSYEMCKEIWRRAEIKREARLKGVKRDKDATLKALYEKYNGICYLCGESCDWNDGKWERGVFRVGGRYPSREHIVALSNGGDDTWNNLKLAHVSCNSKKGMKRLIG